jgi:hypothetical protein
MIAYMNGMKNTNENAKAGANLIEGLSNMSTSIIHNNTDGIGGDFKEYISEGLSTKDVLNAKMIQDMSKTETPHQTIIAFSAGNEDLYKAMRVMQLEGRKLEHPIDVISVGSPRGKGDLEESGKQTGFGDIRQYNDWKDPVSNPKTWLLGATAITVGAAYSAAVVAPTFTSAAASSATFTGTAAMLDRFYTVGGRALFVSGTVGGTVGGVGGAALIGSKLALKHYHSFDGYLSRNVRGVRDAIKGLEK